MNSNWKRSTIIYVVMLVAIIAIFSFLVPNAQKPEEVPLSQIITLSQEHKIAEITVDSETIEVTTTDGTKLSTVKEYIASIYDIEGLDLTDVKVNIQPAGGLDWGTMILTYLPFLIFGGLLIFIFTQARGANNQAVSFGRSKAKLFNMDKPTITFANVAGVDEAKQEVGEVVEFLKSREKFQALGARIPKGILLIGPPGTGKTLLAKAIAGEAGVPFFSISGSEFVEMFVGVGASRVRDLFDQAKKNAPCIIFIDEIDAVGRQRGAGLGGGHDEREQTLNQILVEMDGFDTDTSVIVVAATNRPDILDPALLRPGRFDRRVVLDKPDITGREAILKIHAKGKPLADTVNLENLGKQTVGFSGADLANLLNEAAILAARKNRKVIETEDLEESIDRVIAGPERKSRRISTQEKEVTAYHETGHGLVLRLVQGADPVHKISIVARGMTLGHTRQLPTEDRYLMTRSQFKGMMAGLLAGYVAEELTFKELSTGASDDLRRATDIAHKMVTSYGMSDKLGPRTFGNKEEMVFLGREISEQKDYGEKIADMIDDEVHGLIEEAHQKARKILTENKNRLKFIAEKLVEKETLEGVELESLFTGELPIAEST